MTGKLPTTCVLLCLLLSAACTSAPKPPTPLVIESRPACPLVPCRLPARQAPAENESWPQAVDALEDALLACAVQVIDCIERQK